MQMTMNRTIGHRQLCKKFVALCVLVSVFLKSQECFSAPAEGRSTDLQYNRAAFRGNRANGGQWQSTDPLFMRYHGPGASFAMRGYPTQHDNGATATDTLPKEVSKC